ncbi:MAG: hypothetical protein JXB15_16010 [Anaerolineales bacterium]|nr:hypothetical protein [Anaerolineales bacterium]
MPQLVKGGKWVFGWCVVGPAGEIKIPPGAYQEYGFVPGEDVIITRGSRRSGGFGLGRQEKLANSPLLSRFHGRATIGAAGQVVLPAETGLQPGEHLLAVHGSGLALGFVQRGPIYEEALKHSEIETFESI